MKENFGAFSTLFFHQIKKDYKIILIWIIALGMFAGGFIPAFEEIAKDQGMVAMFEMLNNPAMISIVGPTPVESAEHYTVGAMYSHEMLLFSVLCAFVIAALYIIKNTRKEEDEGLAELVRAFPVGRHTNTAVITAISIIIHVLLAAFIIGLMVSFDVDTISVNGAILFASAISMAGLLGSGVALLFSQLMPTSSAATTMTLMVMGLLYITRGATDISNETLSWFNPLAWSYLTYPFTENNVAPILYSLCIFIVLISCALFIEAKRDLGTGIFSERSGRASARPTLLSLPGLFLRLNKTMIISWLVAFTLLGASYGSIYGDMEKFLSSNEMIKQMFSSQNVTLEQSFTSTIMMVLISVVAVPCIAIINKMYTEEKSLRFSQIFSTKIRRSEIYWTNIILSVSVGGIGTLLTVIGLGQTARYVTTNSMMTFNDFLAIGYSLFPMVLFFIGLSGFIFGFIPQFGKVLYVYLVYGFFINYFKSIIDIPDVVLNTTPQKWLAQIPLESFNLSAYLIVIAVSIVLMIFGVYGYKARDLKEGN